MKRLAILFLATLSLGGCAAKKSYFYVFDYGCHQAVVKEARAKNMTVEPGLVRSARVSARTPAKAKQHYLEEAIKRLERQVKDAQSLARSPFSGSGEGRRARVALLLAEQARLTAALRGLELGKRVAAAHIALEVQANGSVRNPSPIQDRQAPAVSEPVQVAAGHQREDERFLDTSAQALANAIEEALVRGHWSKKKLEDFNGRAMRLDAAAVPRESRVKLALLLGLYAWYVQEPTHAVRLFEAARRLGATDCRLVVPQFWTPGAVLAFRQDP